MKCAKLLVCMASVLMFACNNPKQSEETSEEYVEAAQTPCLAPATWFAMVNGVRATPPPNEGPTSVFANNETVTNCDFHQWSWQKFLWLTNDQNGRPLFLNELMQVTATGQIVNGGGQVILTDVAQASDHDDIMKTNKAFNNQAAADTAYYSIHMNQSLYDTMVKYAPIGNEDPSKIKGVTYPVGALELKVAWVNANSIANPQDYFITEGNINGETVRIALLGMHVVGIVENHPEFVWATFEHGGMAPKYDWASATPTSDATVSSAADMLFFEAGATATVNNIKSKNGIYTNFFSLYEYGTPVQKVQEGDFNVQVFMETSQKGFENYNNIKTINESVKGQLKDIWNNYFYNGSLWINTEGYVGPEAQAALIESLGDTLSLSQKGKLTRGSVAAYNLTMETYVQAGFNSKPIYQQEVTDLVNCFFCHQAGNGSTLNISHVYNGYAKSLQGMTQREIKQQHIDEVKAMVLKMQNKK